MIAVVDYFVHNGHRYNMTGLFDAVIVVFLLAIFFVGYLAGKKKKF